MVQNVMKGQLALLLAEYEVTYGTDPAPVVADNAIYCVEWKIKKVRDMKALKRWGPAYMARGWMPGAAWVEYSFKFPLVGGPDPMAGNLAVPDFSPLLQSGMFSLATTGTPSDTHTYTLSSSAAQLGCTFYAYLYKDGHGTCELVKIVGGRHNTKIEMTAGDEVFITFEGIGLYSLATNPSVPTAPTYVHPLDAMPAVGATLTIGGVAYIVDKFAIDLKYAPEKRMSIGTGTEGVAGIYLGRAPGTGPEGSLDVEMIDEATDSRWATVDAGTVGALVLTLDSIKGSRWAITAPALQFGSPDLSLEGAIAKYSQPFALQTTLDVGDDEFQMVNTRTV